MSKAETARPSPQGTWLRTAPGRGPVWKAARIVLPILALLIAACTSSNDHGGSPSGAATSATSAVTAPNSTATASSAPPTATGAAAAVLAAYRAFWDDLIAAGATANWRSPRLDDHATGRALAQAKATFRLLSERGQVARGTVTVRAKVLSIKGTTATVYDCNSTSNFLAYDARTGELRDKSSGRSNGKTVTLLLTNQVWKVADTVTEVGKCTK